jgi:hypothetical protein
VKWARNLVVDIKGPSGLDLCNRIN